MIKYTSNYICYFSAMSKLTCAKCRLSGRFVKLSIAQAEYDVEYAYISAYKAVLALLVMLWCIYITKPKKAVTSYLERLNNDVIRLNNAIILKVFNYD